MVTVSSLATRRWNTLRGAVAGVAVVVATATALPARTADNRSQAAAPRGVEKLSEPIKPSPGYRITFSITPSNEYSQDQITIIFSDRSWEVRPLPPLPLLGEDIAAEFSFSATDFENRRSLTFTRVVRDLTFLTSRYIRVINHGSDSWGGETITMTVNGRREIPVVKMLPKKGDAKTALQGANRSTWNGKTYWEEELSRIRINPTGS
jgi:hypothetical protein